MSKPNQLWLDNSVIQSRASDITHLIIAKLHFIRRFSSGFVLKKALNFLCLKLNIRFLWPQINSSPSALFFYAQNITAPQVQNVHIPVILNILFKSESALVSAGDFHCGSTDRMTWRALTSAGRTPYAD
jgi:hypothetical protein